MKNVNEFCKKKTIFFFKLIIYYNYYMNTFNFYTSNNVLKNNN